MGAEEAEALAGDQKFLIVSSNLTRSIPRALQGS